MGKNVRNRREQFGEGLRIDVEEGIVKKNDDEAKNVSTARYIILEHS